jgi:hypothetical protein
MLKTEYKFIRFEKSSIDLNWECWNKKGVMLGVCIWWPQWKEFEFLPESYMAFTVECLRDIADFVEQLNQEQKKQGKKP